MIPQIPCFVLLVLTVKILQNKVLLLKARHTVKSYGSIPASLSPSLGSRGPSLFGGQYPLPFSCQPMQPVDKNTQEWALPGCIILDLSIQKAAPKLEEKLPLIEKRGISGVCCTPDMTIVTNQWMLNTWLIERPSSRNSPRELSGLRTLYLQGGSFPQCRGSCLFPGTMLGPKALAPEPTCWRSPGVGSSTSYPSAEMPSPKGV